MSSRSASSTASGTSRHATVSSSCAAPLAEPVDSDRRHAHAPLSSCACLTPFLVGSGSLRGGGAHQEDLALHIAHMAYAPYEDVDAIEFLNILSCGMATRRGVLLAEGSYFGDVILTSVALRDTTPAHTLIYTEVARLSRTPPRQLEPRPFARRPLRKPQDCEPGRSHTHRTTCVTWPFARGTTLTTPRACVPRAQARASSRRSSTTPTRSASSTRRASSSRSSAR